MATSNDDTPKTGASGTAPADTAPAGTAPADTAPAGTAPAGTAPAGDPPAPTENDWASLRARFSKGDEKLEKRLSRYSSTEAALDALIAAQNKISSGELKAPLPKDATPEQLAEWRKEQGIPDKAEGYDLSALPDGRIIGTEDKPLVDAFLKEAHAKNMTPDQVQSTVAWYLAEQEKQIAAQQERDDKALVAAEDALRAEWGSEYRLNVNLVKGLLGTAPEGARDLITNARLADGTPLGSHPEAMRWLAGLARVVNPVATVVPGAGGNAAQAIETEMAGIAKLMGDRGSEYWKGPNSAKMQERYRELLRVQSQIK